mgnify:CR=1 FL=1
MAKQSRSLSFRNATIDFADMTISEYTKESTNVFSLEKVLREWSNIDGLSISIKYDEEAAQDGE